MTPPLRRHNLKFKAAALEAIRGQRTLNESIGASNSDRFNHALTLTAGNNIDVNRSIWLDGDLVLQANATPAALGGLAPFAGTGAVNLVNADPTRLLEVRGRNITIGKPASIADDLSPVRALNLVAANAAAGKDSGVRLQADNALAIKLVSALTATAGKALFDGSAAAIGLGGSSVDINAGGAVTLTAGETKGVAAQAGVNLLAAGNARVATGGNLTLTAGKADGDKSLAGVKLGAANVDLEVGSLAAGGNLLLRAGEASNNGNANAGIEAGTAKRIGVGGDLIMQGGLIKSGLLSRALANIDPSGPMTIAAGRGITLIAGRIDSGPGRDISAASASITNAGQINLLVKQSPLAAGDPPHMTDLSGVSIGGVPIGLVPSGLIFVGNSSSGTFNINARDFSGRKEAIATSVNSVPFGYFEPPITLKGGSVFSYIDLDLTLDRAIVLSGVAGISELPNVRFPDPRPPNFGKNKDKSDECQ